VEEYDFLAFWPRLIGDAKFSLRLASRLASTKSTAQLAKGPVTVVAFVLQLPRPTLSYADVEGLVP